jgi:hypothetical protein
MDMKNVYEVLRQKEMELTRLEKEVEALRLVAPLLSEEKEDMVKPALATAVNGPQASRFGHLDGKTRLSAGRKNIEPAVAAATR